MVVLYCRCTVGRIRRWWGLVMGARPPLCCLIVCLCSSLAGDGGGCSCSPLPSFVSPGCVLLFAVGGGCSPHSCPLLAGDGGGCSCSPSLMLPRCTLPLVVGAWTHSCRLVGCSCPPLVGMVLGTRPFVPLVVCSPLFMWPRCVAPLLHVVMVVSVGGVLLDVYEMKWLTIN